MSIWTPTREWEGQDAFLIGGGPSLSEFDFSQLKGRRVIGCNDAFHLGPEIVSYCVFGDCSWIYRKKWEISESGVELVTCSPTLLNFKFPRLRAMRRKMHGIGSGDTVGWNYSTGALAIDLARMLGARQVFLLGYDMSNQGNKSHWHRHNGKTVQAYSFDRFLRGFSDLSQALKIVPDFQVFNVTDGTSRLDVFPSMTFSALRELLTLSPLVSK